MRKQSVTSMPAPQNNDDLERLVQQLTEVAGGKQDRKQNRDAGQEVIPTKG